MITAARLIVLRGHPYADEIVLRPGKYRIGRAQGCYIKPMCKYASRKHCLLTVSDELVAVSTNQVEPSDRLRVNIEVRLFANLRTYLPAGGDGTRAMLEIPEGTRLREVIERLGIPPQLAQLVMVDGVHEPNRDCILTDGATLSIFPPVAGGSEPRTQRVLERSERPVPGLPA